MIDINELRIMVEEDGKSGIDLEEIHELLDRLEVAEKERGALRTELADLRSSMAFRTSLIGRIEAERDTLRAKVAAMEKQEPIGEMREISHLNWELCWFRSVPFGAKLFTSPGAKGE